MPECDEKSYADSLAYWEADKAEQTKFIEEQGTKYSSKAGGGDAGGSGNNEGLLMGAKPEEISVPLWKAFKDYVVPAFEEDMENEEKDRNWDTKVLGNTPLECLYKYVVLYKPSQAKTVLMDATIRVKDNGALLGRLKYFLKNSVAPPAWPVPVPAP